MGKGTVSIIIPAYNVEKYIEKCLMSVINQSYSDIEVIVVDDGSSDSTLDVINRIAVCDSRIKVIAQENSGVSKARNNALDVATGEFLCFVDGDDYIAHDMIKTLVEKLDTDVDWINYQYCRRGESGQELDSYNFTVGDFDISDTNSKIDFLFNYLLVYLAGYEVWDKLYRMDIVKNNNIRFCVQCKMGEDLGFNLCYAAKAKSIKCIEDRLYYYLVRDSSAMNTISRKKDVINSYLIFVRDVERRWKDMKVDSELLDFTYLIAARAIDNSIRGLNDKEIANILQDTDGLDFYRSINNKLMNNKSTLLKWYGEELGKCMWKHSIYLGKQFGELSLGYRVYSKMLDIYRIARGRKKLEQEPRP